MTKCQTVNRARTQVARTNTKCFASYGYPPPPRNSFNPKNGSWPTTTSPPCTKEKYRLALHPHPNNTSVYFLGRWRHVHVIIVCKVPTKDATLHKRQFRYDRPIVLRFTIHQSGFGGGRFAGEVELFCRGFLSM